MTSAPADVLVIQNPASGRGRPETWRAAIATGFARLGVRAEIVTTSGPGTAAAWARRALAHGVRRIVVAGGDGTISDAAEAVAGSPAVLGVLPLGTGNQLAFHLGIPQSLDAALRVAVHGAVRRLDVGWIRGRAFVAMAGAGLDARVVTKASQAAKRRVGMAAYLAAGLAAGLRPARARIAVRADGDAWEGEGIGVLVANVPALRVPLLRHGLCVVPGAAPDDGFLDGCALAIRHPAGLALELWHAVRHGPHSRRDGRRVRYLRGRTLDVETDPPLPLQLDGDPLGTTPFRATVTPGALRVAVPAPDPGRAAGGMPAR
jgi:diacylglycerol kinase (ATP)